MSNAVRPSPVCQSIAVADRCVCSRRDTRQPVITPAKAAVRGGCPRCPEPPHQPGARVCKSAQTPCPRIATIARFPRQAVGQHEVSVEWERDKDRYVDSHRERVSLLPWRVDTGWGRT